WLLPNEWRPASFADFFRHDVHASGTGWTLAASTVAYLAMSAIEPLYVACGFALYLNRRTQLEAWDIDLAFRRLRARLQDAGKLLGLLLCLGLPLAGHAASPTPPAAKSVAVSTPQEVFRQPLVEDDRRFAAAAAQVYRDPRFGGEHHVRRWEFKYNRPPTQQDVNAGFAPLRMLSGLLNALLWLALGAAVAALAWFAWRWSSGLRDEALPSSFEANLSATVDETPETLPSDVAGTTSARGAGAALPRLCGAHRAAVAIARRHRRHRGGLAAPCRRAGRSGAHAPRRRDRAHLAVRRLRRPLSRPGRVRAIARRLAAAAGSCGIGRRGMKHRGLLVAALVLLGVAVLVGLFLATFQRRDVVEPTPASGAAQTNPLFALEQTLRDMGEPAASLTTLDPRQV